MNENTVVDFWMLFKEYVDKKNVDTVAEKFVDLCVDYGVDDQVLISCLGADGNLDEAVKYYLDLDQDELEEEM